MATTPNRNYPYPGGTDSPAGMTQLQALALAVDADIAALFADTGYFVATAASGYSTTIQARQIGIRVQLIGFVLRSSGVIPATVFESAFTLPTQVAAPPTSELYALPGVNTGAANGLMMQTTAGSRLVKVSATGTSGATAWVSGVSYLAD